MKKKEFCRAFAGRIRQWVQNRSVEFLLMRKDDCGRPHSFSSMQEAISFNRLIGNSRIKLKEEKLRFYGVLQGSKEGCLEMGRGLFAQNSKKDSSLSSERVFAWRFKGYFFLFRKLERSKGGRRFFDVELFDFSKGPVEEKKDLSEGFWAEEVRLRYVKVGKTSLDIKIRI